MQVDTTVTNLLLITPKADNTFNFQQ